MSGSRGRPAVAGDDRARWLRRRFGEELRNARLSVGLTQDAVARISRTSQAQVSRAERGLGEDVSLADRCRLAAAVGHELGWALYPVSTVRLRDSGQLEIAQAIAAAAGSAWKVNLEMPVGDRSSRAADLVLLGPEELIHMEIERRLFDLQAQLRAGQLKRRALAERSDRPVRFVLVVPDTTRNRRHLISVEGLVRRSLPIQSRAVWAAIRSGHPLGADGVLVLRRPPRSPS